MNTSLRTQNVAFVALVCGMGATLFAWFLAGRQVEGEAQREFAGRVNLAASTLERPIQRYVDVLYGLEALAYHDPALSRSEFFRYVSALDLGRRFPDVQAVAFIRRGPDAEREEFVARVREDRTMSARGYPQFDIRPEERRDEYWVIDFVENEGVFGLDIRTRAGALEAAERARDTGEPSVTSRYRLAQEKGTSFGLILYLAVYALDRPRTAAARRESLRGFVNVVLRAKDMLADLLTEPVISGLRMQVHDVGPGGGAAMAA